MYFVDGEFLEGTGGVRCPRPQLGDLKSGAWSLQAPAHTHLGGAVRWPRNELRCQLELLSVAAGFFTEKSVEREPPSETHPCLPLNLGNQAVPLPAHSAGKAVTISARLKGEDKEAPS